MNKGDTVQIKGEVVSTKPKWDRHDKNALSVVVKADNKPYWFQWSSSRGAINVGDTVELTATVNGQGEVRKKGQPPMTFLDQVQIEGTPTCNHLVVGCKDDAYSCVSCGEPMTVIVTSSLESPK